jgi:hypothetical protein
MRRSGEERGKQKLFLGDERARSSSNRLLAFLILLGHLPLLVACAESSSSEVEVRIPRVFINCTTPHCKTTPLPAFRVTAIFSTSGCQRYDFGATISGGSGETAALSCNPTSGCYGEVTSWIDATGRPVTTMPSGTYSICARIDFNGDYPAGPAGDTLGSLDNVFVSDTTANQFLTTWTDL